MVFEIIQRGKGQNEGTERQHQAAGCWQRLRPIRRGKKDEHHGHDGDDGELKDVRERAFVGQWWTRVAAQTVRSAVRDRMVSTMPLARFTADVAMRPMIIPSSLLCKV